MIIKPISLTLITSLILSGCSHSLLQSPKEQHANSFINAAQAKQTLTQKQACCSDFSQLRYQEIDTANNLLIPLTEDSQVYNFPSGKSFVQAYKLTDRTPELKLKIAALIANTVVAPQITLLDGNFNITRTLSANDFVYQKAKLFNDNALSAEITIYRPQASNIANETYLLFYTTKQAIAGSTTIIHPAKSYAIAHNTVPPSIADPIISHSAMGLIEVKFAGENTDQASISKYIPLTIFSKEKEKLADSTEDDFNRAIESAVMANNINEALTIIDQAEAAGSKTAKMTFVNTLNRNTAHIQSAAEKEIIKAVSTNNIEKALTLVEKEEAQGSTTARETFIKALKNKKK